MADFSDTLSITASGMKAQAARLRHTAENIANADTTGYRRKLVSFEETFARDGHVEVSPVKFDQTALQRRYDPANPLADEKGTVEGSNVNLLIEVADAREAQRSYEANVQIFSQIRQMSSALLDLLRR